MEERKKYFDFPWKRSKKKLTRSFSPAERERERERKRKRLEVCIPNQHWQKEEREEEGRREKPFISDEDDDANSHTSPFPTFSLFWK